jgi:hypothetical protein
VGAAPTIGCCKIIHVQILIDFLYNILGVELPCIKHMERVKKALAACFKATYTPSFLLFKPANCVQFYKWKNIPAKFRLHQSAP